MAREGDTGERHSVTIRSAGEVCSSQPLSIMSTICKLCIPATAGDVLPCVREELAGSGTPYQESETEWPAFGRSGFLLSDEFPTVLFIRQVTQRTTEIYFNSFCEMEAFADRLSDQLETLAVVILYQSVSTASYWALHRDGGKLRSVAAGDGEIYEEYGDRLDFENDPPGRDVSDCD